MKYATLDDSSRKIDLEGCIYEVEVHCLCDSSDNIKYLAILKGKHKKVDPDILKKFVEGNLEDHELYACAFYKSLDLGYPVLTYINRRNKKRQAKNIKNLFQKADHGARNYSKRITLKLKSLRDIRRERNIGHLNGIELLLMDI